MGVPWSKAKRRLEEEYLCQKLRGRVRYFATTYRKSHDREGRAAIVVDGKEVLQGNYYDWWKKYDSAHRALVVTTGRKDPWEEAGRIALEEGGFDQYNFYNAFREYDNQSIDVSLQSVNPIVRIWAVLDRRCGKRRLKKLEEDLRDQPEFVRFFFALRLEAEGLPRKSGM